MSRTSVNERHAHHERVNALARKLATLGEADSVGLMTELLNLVNEAYAQGYRDGDPENRQHMAVPDGSVVIMDGAGRVISHVPPRTVVDGTVSGRLRTYVDASGHLVIWDKERAETIGMFEIPENVAFNVSRVDGTMQGESPSDQQWAQIAEEVRTRWAASRAAVPPHYIVCLPHDFEAALKEEAGYISDDHAEASGAVMAVNMFVDKLDKWTEWDARKGWR